MIYWVKGVMLVCLLALSYDVQAHDIRILECDKNIIYRKVEKVMENINENRTISEWYDTNADGLADIEALSYITQITCLTPFEPCEYEHKDAPFRYHVDVDYDGFYDFAYIDKTGTGKCEDIVFEQDFRSPTAPWRNPNNKKEGQTHKP